MGICWGNPLVEEYAGNVKFGGAVGEVWGASLVAEGGLMFCLLLFRRLSAEVLQFFTRRWRRA